MHKNRCTGPACLCGPVLPFDIMFQKKRVVIGGAGVMGWQIAKLLNPELFDVTVIDRKQVC
jgi:hypothetical protein